MYKERQSNLDRISRLQDLLGRESNGGITPCDNVMCDVCRKQRSERSQWDITWEFIEGKNVTD